MQSIIYSMFSVHKHKKYSNSKEFEISIIVIWIGKVEHNAAWLI